MKFRIREVADYGNGYDIIFGITNEHSGDSPFVSKREAIGFASQCRQESEKKSPSDWQVVNSNGTVVWCHPKNKTLTTAGGQAPFDSTC